MKNLIRLTRLSLIVLTAFMLLPAISPSAAIAAEHSLAGVKTFSPIATVLRRFGDPTFITSGYQPATVLFTYGRPTLINPNSFGNATAGSPFNSDTAMQPMGGQGMQDPFDPLYDGASRYYYDIQSKGLIYEFVATEAGRVVEIKVYGYRGEIRTSEGIGLGSTYAEIVLKYGYPEQTISDINSDGTPLTLVYANSAHVSFRLIRNRVAVISVVAPD